MSFLAGTVYPYNDLGKCLTQKMLAHGSLLSPQVIKEGRFELGSSQLVRHHNKIILFCGDLQEPNPEERIGMLYDRYREDLALHLHGSFAIVILDLDKQELLLFRDRIGEQTLYWSLQDQTFFFANSLKSILSSDAFSRSCDLEAISYYLGFGFIPQEKTLLKKVFRLQPGHYLRYTKDNNLFIRPYWAYNTFLKKKNDTPQLVQLEQMIDQSWAAHRKAAQSAVVIQDLRNQKVDLPSDLPVVCLNSFPIDPEEVLHELPNMVLALDEPIADLKFPERYLVCKKLKKENTTDLFFLTGSLEWLYEHIQPPLLKDHPIYQKFKRLTKLHFISPFLSRLHLKSAYAMLRSANTHPWHKAFLRQSALFIREEFHDLHSTLLKPVNAEIFLHRFPALEKLGPSLRSLLYLFFKTKMPSLILHSEVKLCSHFGFKRHAPYLASNIIEWIASLPEKSNRFSLEHILVNGRKPLHHRIAPELPLWAQKMDFQRLMRTLKDSLLVEAGILSASWFEEQMHNFNRHPHLFFHQVWGILVLETWFRLYIESDSLSALST